MHFGPDRVPVHPDSTRFGHANLLMAGPCQGRFFGTSPLTFVFTSVSTFVFTLVKMSIFIEVCNDKNLVPTYGWTKVRRCPDFYRYAKGL